MDDNWVNTKEEEHQTLKQLSNASIPDELVSYRLFCHSNQCIYALGFKYINDDSTFQTVVELSRYLKRITLSMWEHLEKRLLDENGMETSAADQIRELLNNLIRGASVKDAARFRASVTALNSKIILLLAQNDVQLPEKPLVVPEDSTFATFAKQVRFLSRFCERQCYSDSIVPSIKGLTAVLNRNVDNLEWLKLEKAKSTWYPKISCAAMLMEVIGTLLDCCTKGVWGITLDVLERESLNIEYILRQAGLVTQAHLVKSMTIRKRRSFCPLQRQKNSLAHVQTPICSGQP